MRIEAEWEKGDSAAYFRPDRQARRTDGAVLDGEGQGGEALLMALASALIGMGKAVAKKHGLAIDAIDCRVEGISEDGAHAGCRDIRMTLTVCSSEDESRLDAWLKEVERNCPVRGDGAGRRPLAMVVEN